MRMNARIFAVALAATLASISGKSLACPVDDLQKIDRAEFAATIVETMATMQQRLPEPNGLMKWHDTLMEWACESPRGAHWRLLALDHALAARVAQRALAGGDGTVIRWHNHLTGTHGSARAIAVPRAECLAVAKESVNPLFQIRAVRLYCKHDGRWVRSDPE